MSDNKCVACGQWSGRGHKCPPPETAATRVATVHAPACEPVEVNFNLEDLESRIARAREHIDYDTRTRLNQDRVQHDTVLTPEEKELTRALLQENLNREVRDAMGWDHNRTEYYEDGLVRRVRANGEELWTDSNGELHREDGPAMILATGNAYWFTHGKKHRDGDQPAEESPDGLWRAWYQNDQLHRDGDLPAIDNPKEVAWFVHGVPHRTTGPAIIDKNTGKSRWIINGHEVPAPPADPTHDPNWAAPHIQKYGTPTTPTE